MKSVELIELIDNFEEAVRLEERGGFKGVQASGRRMRVEFARRQLLSAADAPPNLDHALNELRECLDDSGAPPSQQSFPCAARGSTLPEPADCDWPVCGCDPYASKVIAALQESGKLDEGEAPLGRKK